MWRQIERERRVRLGAGVLAVVLLTGAGLWWSPAASADDDDDDDDREEIVGSFVGQGSDFAGVIDDEGAFIGVADLVAQTAVWTFVDGDDGDDGGDDDDGDDGDDDDDNGDDRDTLSNRTTEFVIDFANPDPDTGRFPYRQVIEFTGGTGDFEDASGGAVILGTIDVVTFAYDGDIDGEISTDD